MKKIQIRAIRTKLGLSQSEFSTRYQISLRTLQQWEQGRREPEGAVLAYLRVIERNPELVRETLEL